MTDEPGKAMHSGRREFIRSWDELQALIAEDPVWAFLLAGEGLAEMHEVLGPQSQEKNCLLFVRAWAEAVLHQVSRVRALRAKNVVDSRNYERDEDWSPTAEDLQRNFRSMWTEEHTLVWAAYQLEQWSQRLAKERGQEPPGANTVLKKVRDALEHLDDARFSGDYAVPGAVEKGPYSNRSLRALPDSRLRIATGGDLSFGLINPQELESRALAAVRAIEDELDEAAADQYFSMLRE